MTEKELIEALAGVAKAQAALFSALAPDDFAKLQELQARLGEIIGLGKPTKPVMTWETLPSQLLLHALARREPHQPALIQAAHQHVAGISRKGI
jgi:hypothetical protein